MRHIQRNNIYIMTITEREEKDKWIEKAETFSNVE